MLALTLQYEQFRLHAPVALHEVIIRGPFCFPGGLEQDILSNPLGDKSVLTLRILKSFRFSIYAPKKSIFLLREVNFWYT